MKQDQVQELRLQARRWALFAAVLVVAFVMIGLGTLLGGWSVKPLSERGYADAPLRVILAVAALWLLPAVLGPLSPTAGWALIAAAPIVFFLNAYFGVAVAALP